MSDQIASCNLANGDEAKKNQHWEAAAIYYEQAAKQARWTYTKKAVGVTQASVDRLDFYATAALQYAEVHYRHSPRDRRFAEAGSAIEALLTAVGDALKMQSTGELAQRLRGIEDRGNLLLTQIYTEGAENRMSAGAPQEGEELTSASSRLSAYSEAARFYRWLAGHARPQAVAERMLFEYQRATRRQVEVGQQHRIFLRREQPCQILEDALQTFESQRLRLGGFKLQELSTAEEELRLTSQICWAESEYDAAEELQRSESTPGNPEYREKLGQAYRRAAERYDTLVRSYGSSPNLTGGTVALWIERANLSYRRAFQFSPQRSDLQYSLACAHNKLQKDLPALNPRFAGERSATSLLEVKRRSLVVPGAVLAGAGVVTWVASGILWGIVRHRCDGSIVNCAPPSKATNASLPPLITASVATSSIGGITLIGGATLLIMDTVQRKRAKRKLQACLKNAPTPMFGAYTVGLALGCNF